MAPLGHRFHICLEVCYHVSDSGRSHTAMNYPAAGLRGIRCHAGLDKPAPAIGKPGASSLDFWIPTFIRLWRICRDDDSPQAGGMKRKILTLSPSPADCKKLSIYTVSTPLPKERELAETPPQADGVLKKWKRSFILNIWKISRCGGGVRLPRTSYGSLSTRQPRDWTMWTENGRISRTLSQSLVFKDMEPEKELKLLDVVCEFNKAAP